MKKFEYLDPEKLVKTDDFKIIEAFLQLTRRTQIGWHYIIDLTWIYQQAKHWPAGTNVLDAGGGSGPVQYLLAEMGMNVINIDLFHPTESNLPFYGKRYALTFRHFESYKATDYVAHLKSVDKSQSGLTWLRKIIASSAVTKKIRYITYFKKHDQWRQLAGLGNRSVGKITRIVGNLCNMPEIPTKSFDAVVSVSALEHIPIAILPSAIAEIKRVVLPNAFCAITTSATEKLTWHHEPSKGLCFSDEDLNKYFGAAKFCDQTAVEVLENYKSSSYLKNHLANFYSLSGNNGMPWGKWDPQYIPVGIR